jgi:hypothetical protein
MCELKVPHVKKIIMWFGVVSTIDDYSIFVHLSYCVSWGVICPI